MFKSTLDSSVSLDRCWLAGFKSDVLTRMSGHIDIATLREFRYHICMSGQLCSYSMLMYYSYTDTCEY
jgi:hypothetical protein